MSGKPIKNQTTEAQANRIANIWLNQGSDAANEAAAEFSDETLMKRWEFMAFGDRIRYLYLGLIIEIEAPNVCETIRAKGELHGAIHANKVIKDRGLSNPSVERRFLSRIYSFYEEHEIQAAQTGG